MCSSKICFIMIIYIMNDIYMNYRPHGLITVAVEVLMPIYINPLP